MVTAKLLKPEEYSLARKEAEQEKAIKLAQMEENKMAEKAKKEKADKVSKIEENNEMAERLISLLRDEGITENKQKRKYLALAYRLSK